MNQYLQKQYLQKHPDGLLIAGISHQVGSECLTNKQLIDRYGIRIKESFINKSVGIETRYFISDDETTSDLAAIAGKNALKNANIDVDKLDRLIVATSTPDHQTPSTACIVQHKLGGRGFPASDIVAACSGFMYALDQGLRCLATGDKYVLIVGVDCRSRTLNMQDKRTAFLYGDGAGAVVLKRVEGIENDRSEKKCKKGFFDCMITADGEGHDAVFVPAGGAKTPCTIENVQAMEHKLSMPNGERVAKNALQGFMHMSHSILQRNNLNLTDVDHVVFHQPNRRLLEAVMRDMNIDESKAFINFEKYGNTVAGSIPIALSEVINSGRAKVGDKILLCSVGGGFTAGAALYQY